MELSEIMSEVTGVVRLGAHRTAKQARSRQKLDRVLAAATEIIESAGPSALTATGVAARAHVSAGWLYTYFETLEGVLEEIMVAGLRELDGVLDGVGFELSGPGWRSKAETGLSACVDYFEAHAGFRKLWFSSEFSGRMSQANRLHDNLLAAHLAASVGEVRAGAPDVSLVTVMRTFVGILDKGIDLAYRDDANVSDAELIGEMKRTGISYLETYLE